MSPNSITRRVYHWDFSMWKKSFWQRFDHDRPWRNSFVWPIQSNRENSSLLHTNQYQTDILFSPLSFVSRKTVKAQWSVEKERNIKEGSLNRRQIYSSVRNSNSSVWTTSVCVSEQSVKLVRELSFWSYVKNIK